MTKRTKSLIGAIILLFIVGIFVLWSRGLFPAVANVQVSIISGAGGMPPGEFAGEVYKEPAKVVFTEPFKSLSAYKDAKVIRTLSTSSGHISTNLPRGKYGLYIVTGGQTILYDQLQLTPYDVKANLGDRGARGDWYIEVNGLHNEFQFSLFRSPS